MKTTTTVLSLVAGLALAGCAPEPPRVREGVPPAASRPTGKLDAPVEISAVVATGSAKVTVVFLRNASDVTIAFAGLDGLQLTSPARPVSGVEFAAGASTTLDVTFQAPEGQSNLGIYVTGQLGSTASSKVATVTIGTPSALQRRSGAGTVKVDAHGELIHDLPALPNP
jgi:hypothetical protein